MLNEIISYNKTSPPTPPTVKKKTPRLLQQLRERIHMRHCFFILVMVQHYFGRVTNLQIFETVICLNGRDIWSTGRIPLITGRERNSLKLKEKILVTREARRDA
jgi:hypothetical protein